MEFNVDKCHVLGVTNEQKPVTFKSYLHGKEFQTVKSAEYRGIELSRDMKWGKYTFAIADRAS